MSPIPSGLKSIVNEDGAVILNSAQNQITTLDAMGGYIWRQLQDGLTPEEIVEHLVLETGAERETIQMDFTEFVGDLTKLRLVSMEPSLPETRGGAR